MIDFSSPLIKENQRDWLLWGTISILVTFGMIVFFSTSLPYSEAKTGNPYYHALKQFSILGVGLILFWICSFFPSKTWRNFRQPLYIFTIVLLIFVLVMGPKINGSQRWLDLGVFVFQVSELAKLVLIVYLAGYIAKSQDKMQQQPFFVFWVFFFPVVLMCMLLILEPDLGNTIEVIFITLGLTFVAGVHYIGFITLLLFLTIGASLMIKFFIAPYQLDRILEFTNPWNDELGKDYSIMQSLTSMARGDIGGVGLGNSIHKFGYIPEAHTDFIVSVLAEELGLIGLTCLIILYLIMFYRLYKLTYLALKRKKVFCSMVVFGVILWLFCQVVFNVGGAIQLIPVKGLVLPFFSKGGSFILIFSITLGLIFSIEKEVRFSHLEEKNPQNINPHNLNT